MENMIAEPNNDPSVTRSLHRSIKLMRLLSTRTRIGWQLSDLADMAGLSPATTHRLLSSLVEERLATRVPGTKRYTLGVLVFELGIAAGPHFDLDRLAKRRLLALARELQGTVFLKIRSGLDSVCVARHDGVAPINALMLDVGGRRPLCLTAGGVALLIQLPQSLQEDIESQNLRALTLQQDARLTGVRRMLRRSRQLGFGLNLGDIVPGIYAISVPLFVENRRPIASMTLALTTANPGPSMAAVLASRLYEEATAIEPLFAQLRY